MKCPHFCDMVFNDTKCNFKEIPPFLIFLTPSTQFFAETGQSFGGLLTPKKYT